MAGTHDIGGITPPPNECPNRRVPLRRRRRVVAHVEREVRNISLDNIEKLAVALGVEVFELLRPTI